ncbi:MAG TPA: hypothetical protein V6D25_04110 [Leptolyngbyaceae cyanobacterium]
MIGYIQFHPMRIWLINPKSALRNMMTIQVYRIEWNANILVGAIA